MEFPWLGLSSSALLREAEKKLVSVCVLRVIYKCHENWHQSLAASQTLKICKYFCLLIGIRYLRLKDTLHVVQVNNHTRLKCTEFSILEISAF